MKIFKYRLLNHILFWISIYSFYSLPAIISSGSFANAKINLTLLPFDLITVYIIIGFLIPRFLFQKKFLLLIFGSALAIAFNIIVTQYFKYNIHPRMGYWIMPRPLSVDIFYALLTNFMIVGMATAMKLLSHSFKMQLTQSEFERRSVQSELGVLRSQVNPHFLFNVLNNIDSLIFENKEKASNAIFLLSKIMRFMLQESSEEKVMLDKELTYINDYLELAKLSFEDKNYVNFKITGEVGGKMVPPLLFIPVIENAVKHCNKQSPSPGISIHFTIGSNYIILETSNFTKSTSVKLPDNSSGTGLKNVKKRLAILYKENFTLKIEKTDNKFNVYLKTPLS
ncbi:MAG: histidine kinase [Prolixibacteraceae bacterium]|nr:histidine kinase [Prolixibacteraceae bacterium]MBN2772611.1 histidine kinase [Prolixibacteraceae bacterium]